MSIRRSRSTERLRRALHARTPIPFTGAAPERFWSTPLESVLAALGTTREGIPADEAERRLATHGPNRPVDAREPTALGQLLAQFRSPITMLLLAAAVLSLGLGERTDGAIILGMVGASAMLGFWQEWRAAGAVRALVASIHTTATVLRSGRPERIAMERVVPGDVVRLSAGALVPGDARLLSARGLFVDEAALTGEPYPAEKRVGAVAAETPLADRCGSVHLGTHVVSGTGDAVIVRTGASTEFGAVAHRLALRPPATEFELGVRRFGYLLLEITTALTLTIVVVNIALDRPALESLLFALALAVGLTPQLLPAIVSVTLAHGARRMARARVVVRRLAAIEDLGGMQVLCTDKTGTLTEGRAAVHAAEDFRGTPSASVRLLAYLNAAFETGYPNPLDDALRAAGAPDAAAYTKEDEIPYDFVRRRLSVVLREGERRVLVTKGALASVLEICDEAEDASGTRVPLEQVRAEIESRLESLSRDGHRCLGVAYRELGPGPTSRRADERGLVFAGILSLEDPLKASARASIRELAGLGVRVKLLTGDNRFVARRVAADAGLDADAVVSGAELHRLGEAALVHVASRVSVFAELDPVQKERVIRALKKGGTSVGYLGDGINDAPALHAADVGVSVDDAVSVTRQAADVVLLEKDLAVLGEGVREGRRAFANTLKYVFITTSASFGNMFSMAGASLFASFLPLLPKQVLLINVLTDLPAMAIATDRLDAELVDRPRRWDTAGIRRFMLSFGLVSSLFDFLTFGALLALRVPTAVFRTAWLTESVLSELLILLVVRTRRPLFRSAPSGALGWTSVAVATGTLALPYSGAASVLGLAPLDAPTLGVVATVLVLYTVSSELTKRALLGRVPL